MRANVKKIFLAVVAIVVGLPLALLLGITVWLRTVDRTNATLVSSGVKRDYLLYVPPTYDPSKRVPLVISMHGAALWPASQAKMSGWNKLAERDGFIVAYPAGRRMAPLPILPQLPVWRVESDTGLAEDVRFISDLIDHLERAYSIDSRRIYITGFSNGGGLAFALSCSMPRRIAAVGIVAGAQAVPWSRCRDLQPVPMIAFHGTADRLAPYRGGKTASQRQPFPNIETWTARWAERNGCSPQPIKSQASSHVRRAEYVSCSGDASVVLYTVEGGGHTWPGGRPLPRWMVGSTSDAIDATAEMWGFFRKHELEVP